MRALFGFLLVSAAVCAQDAAQRKPDRVVSISAERFTFNPSKVTVHEGELIEFVLTSEDTDHGFRIVGTGIDVAIPPLGKGEARIRFVASAKGRFVYECSRPCGAGHNLMRGALIVK